MLSAFVTQIGLGLGLLALAGAAYTALAGVLVLRFFRSGDRPPPLAGDDSVTILKPLHGWEPGLRRNLESHFEQVTAGPVEIVIGVHDPADQAVGVAQSVIADHASTATRICHGAADQGYNRKIANVINMLGSARGQVLVMSDSDIGAPPDHLARVLGALNQPGVGVVTCPYYGKAESGFWSRFAAMGVSYSFLPNMIAGVSLGLAKPCMGSTIALRRETLDKIGGFGFCRNALADDYAIGAAVRGVGLTSAVAPVLVSHSFSETDPRALIAHELRWAGTIKRVDFAGHAGSIVTHPLPLALAACLMLGFSSASLAVLAASFAARIWLKVVVDQVVGRKLGDWWLIPARDAVSFAVFAGSFLAQSVEWRGRRFRVSSDGELIPI
jgi:ceramide glucosyltransferase